MLLSSFQLFQVHILIYTKTEIHKWNLQINITVITLSDVLIHCNDMTPNLMSEYHDLVTQMFKLHAKYTMQALDDLINIHTQH